MKPNYEAAWDLYYTLADRRRRAGLTFDQLAGILPFTETPGIA